MKQLIKIPDYYKNLPTESECYLVTLTLGNGGKVEIHLEINWQTLTTKVLHELLKQLIKNDECTIAIENITDLSSLTHVLTVSAAMHALPQLLALNDDYFFNPEQDFFKAEPWASTKSFTLVDAYLNTSVVSAEWAKTKYPIPF